MSISTLVQDVEQKAKKTYGTIPNFMKEMNQHTGAPGAAYLAADDALMGGLLSPAEQQAVLLSLSQHHDSRYDAIVHARLALNAGLDPSTIDRILADELPNNERLRALILATRRTYDDRGWLDAQTVQQLQQKGIRRGELYEIFALFGLKTFSSYVNHIVDPNLDAGLESTEEKLDNVPEKPSTVELRRLVLG